MPKRSFSSVHALKPLALSIGEPAGIGTEIAARADGVLRVAGETGIDDPPDVGTRFEEAGDGETVLAVTLDAQRGQFIKLDPGAAGKLLSLISLQNLPRRISLDFKDVFSEGLAFDTIAGKLAVQKGVMRTDLLQIDSPSARVLMRGEVDAGPVDVHLRQRLLCEVLGEVTVGGQHERVPKERTGGVPRPALEIVAVSHARLPLPSTHPYAPRRRSVTPRGAKRGP